MVAWETMTCHPPSYHVGVLETGGLVQLQLWPKCRHLARPQRKHRCGAGCNIAYGQDRILDPLLGGGSCKKSSLFMNLILKQLSSVMSR